MADYKDRMKDYVQVNERIEEFYQKYPEGSLQSEIVSHTESLIVMKAWAYRAPDDSRPGIGHSWMEIPGTTPYTEGSEMENAETSAWGRALAALGMKVKKGIATRDEIEGKGERQQSTNACPACGVVGAIIKGRPEYGGGWLCYKKKGGCGEQFATDPALADGGMSEGADVGPRGSGQSPDGGKKPKYESPNKANPADVAKFWADCIAAMGMDEATRWVRARWAEQEPPIRSANETLSFMLINWRKELDEFIASDPAKSFERQLQDQENQDGDNE
jgi:hypothetical protein